MDWWLSSSVLWQTRDWTELFSGTGRTKLNWMKWSELNCSLVDEENDIETETRQQGNILKTCSDTTKHSTLFRLSHGLCGLPSTAAKVSLLSQPLHTIACQVGTSGSVPLTASGRTGQGQAGVAPGTTTNRGYGPPSTGWYFPSPSAWASRALAISRSTHSHILDSHVLTKDWPTRISWTAWKWPPLPPPPPSPSLSLSPLTPFLLISVQTYSTLYLKAMGRLTLFWNHYTISLDRLRARPVSLKVIGGEISQTTTYSDSSYGGSFEETSSKDPRV